MYRENIKTAQLTAWIFAATVPTAIQLTANAPWASLLLIAVISLLCTLIRWYWGVTPQWKGYRTANWILTILLLTTVGTAAVHTWPIGSHKAVAIILYALALWSSTKGLKAAASVGSVIFCFLIVLYLIMFSEAAGHVNLQWLKPTRGMVGALGTTVLLTPAFAASLLDGRKKPDRRCILTGIFCVAAAMLTAGVLSPWVAVQEENSFYQVIRSIPNRFEAVLSAATTMGWFLLIALYLSFNSHKINSTAKGKGAWSATFISSLMIMLNISIPEAIVLMTAVILWIVIPVLHGVALERKKSKKLENSA